MIGVFPLLGEGSGIGSRIREKYLDRPLSSLRPFPTTFKRSILRRIDGLELIYRAAAPPLIPGMLSLTRRLDRKYFLNVNNLINISLFLKPPSCRTRSRENSGRVFFTLTTLEPEISVQEDHHYRLHNNAPGFNIGRSEEREKPSDPGRKSAMTFQRRFSSFREERFETARQGNVYLRGTSQGTFVGSGGRSRMIPTFDLLRKERSRHERYRDTSSIISERGMRPEFEERNRSGTKESDGQRRTIITMPATDLLIKEKSRYDQSQDRSSTVSDRGTRPGFEGRGRPDTNESDAQRRTIATMPATDLLHKGRYRDEWYQDRSSIISSTGTRQGFEGRGRPDTNESDGQKRTIATKPATDLLHKGRYRRDRSQDVSSIFSGTGSRPLSRETDRSGTNGSVGRMMIFVPEAMATIRGISPKCFGISSTVGADLEMMTHTTPIVHADLSAMRWPPLSRGGKPTEVRSQISKPGSENLPSLDFAEDLRRNVPGRNSAPSEPRMTYRRYPELELVEPVETKIIKEVDLLREKKPVPDLDGRSIDLNLDRISDQVYSMIERRIRTERERRGLYG